MPLLRFPRLSLKRICLCTLLTAVVTSIAVFALIVFCIALPMRRAHYLELDYQQKLFWADIIPGIRPRIEDIPQLFYWSTSSLNFPTYEELLGLNYDGTAMALGEVDVWIYLAGTAEGSKIEPNAFTHRYKEHGCDDPAYMCDMYLSAFQRISERWHGTERAGLGHEGTSKAILRWVDCDVSPMLCSPVWGLSGGNLLVHMKVGKDCNYSLIPTGSCPITWRWIALPIYQAPWTRQIRIPLDRGGSTVVPAFSSAEEQMWNVMAYAGAEEGFDFEDEASENSTLLWNTMTTITPQTDDFPETSEWPYPFLFWGGFRSLANMPLDAADEWPYENEVKCYIERYLDLLLQWWDDAATIVLPRSCQGLAEARRLARGREQERQEEKLKLKGAWDRVMNKSGLDPNWIHKDDDPAPWARDLLGGLGVGFW